MTTPVTAARPVLVPARLVIEQPAVEEPEVPFKFNPTEYRLEKSNNFSEIAIPGLETPPIQYVRGTSETLSAELLVDTSDTLEDVEERYVKKLRDLLKIRPELHAPPIVRFVWDRDVFRGVLESLGVTYVLFTPEGVPLRANLSVTLKEYRPVQVQVREREKESPDLEKRYVVRRGDTLSSIAAAVYRDASAWRAIARANGIVDPRFLEAGQSLTLPRLR